VQLVYWPMALISYLEQLKSLASECGWRLKDACADAGISATTYYRWINGTTSPRLKQAERVAKFMQSYQH